jgi:hypothetical protein
VSLPGARECLWTYRGRAAIDDGPGDGRRVPRGGERGDVQPRESVGNTQRLAALASRLSLPRTWCTGSPNARAFENEVVLQPARDAERQGRDDDLVVVPMLSAAWIEVTGSRSPMSPVTSVPAASLGRGKASGSTSRASSMPISCGLATFSPLRRRRGRGDETWRDRCGRARARRRAERASPRLMRDDENGCRLLIHELTSE